jgi:HlyD family secretion protein/adhesin transport system membrane fusion protein
MIKKNPYTDINQLRYLSQSALMEEVIAPHTVRATLVLISLVIVGLVIWSGFTHIDELAITNGEVIPGKHIQSIQHLEGGIISEIKVMEGELVDKGQILLTLDRSGIEQDLSSLKAKRLSFEYQSLRLKAFIDQKTPDFSQAKDSTDKALELEQLRAFESTMAAEKNEKDILEHQIAQKYDAMSMLKKKKITLEANIKLIEEEKELKKILADKGHLSKFKYLEIEKQFNAIKGEISETESEITQANNSIKEYEERRESLETKYKDDAWQDLNQVQINMAQIDQSIRKLEEKMDRLEIRSPSYGYVKGLKIRTIGGVIEPGQVLVEIVPLEGNLIVETQINPKDVGHIKVGENVKIQFNAFESARYGTVSGKLEYISASTFVSSDGSRYYIGRVSLAQNYVGNDPKQNIILPGMIVQANIVTGNKSVLNYLLKPIRTNIDKALTER